MGFPFRGIAGSRRLAFAVMLAGLPLAAAATAPKPLLFDMASKAVKSKEVGLPELPLVAAAATADGKWMAVASDANDIFVWDPATPKSLFKLAGHTELITQLAFSPDGKTLASASHDHTAKLWDLAVKKELRTLKGHTGAVHGIAFSPDGKTIATGAYDKTVRLWDAESGELAATWTEHSAGVRAVAFCPDGKTVASAGGDRVVKLTDMATGKVRFSLKGHKGTVRSLAFAPDGKTLASGAEDTIVKLWDTDAGTVRQSLEGHADIVTVVRFSPAGTTLAAASFSGTVAIWDPRTGRHRMNVNGHGQAVTGLAFLADGRLFSAGLDKNVQLASPVSEADPGGKPISLGSDPVTAIAMSPDASLAVAGRHGGDLVIVKTMTAEIVKPIAAAHVGGVAGLDWSSDGKWIASAGADGKVKLWDAAKFKKLQEVPGRFAAFSPDGKRLAVADGPDVQVYKVPTMFPGVRLAGGHDRPITHLAWNAKGTSIATGGEDSFVRLWDATGEKGPAFPSFPLSERVVGMAFNPDGKTLAVAAKTPPVVNINGMDIAIGVRSGVWLLPIPVEGQTPPAMLPQKRDHPAELTAIGWTGDGKKLVTADCFGQVQMISPSGMPKSNGRQPANSEMPIRLAKTTDQFRAHTAPILAMDLRPAAGAMMTASEDGTATRWDLVGGAISGSVVAGPITASRILEPDGKDVWVAELSPDGKRLVTGGSGVGGLGRPLRIYEPIPAPSPRKFQIAPDMFGVWDLAFSPDGKTLVSAHGSAEIGIWNVATGKLERQLTGAHKKGVWGVAFHADGRTVASVGGVGAMLGEGFLWDLKGNGKPRPLEDIASAGRVRAPVFSPDGKQLAAACNDGTIRVWDTATGKLIHTLDKHTRTARAVAYTPDGSQIISTGLDVWIRIWDAATGKPLKKIKVTDGWPMRLVVGPDGRDIVVAVRSNPDKNADGPGLICVYSLASEDENARPRVFKGHSSSVQCVAFLGDKKTLISTGGKEKKHGEVFVWDFATGKLLGQFQGHTMVPEAMQVSPDGKTLASGGGGKSPGEIFLWDTAGFRPAVSYPVDLPAGFVTAAAYSPDGKTLLAAGKDGTVLVLDMADPAHPQLKETLDGHMDMVRSVDFDRDGRRFATADEHGVVKLWDAAKLTAVASFRTTYPVHRVRFSPDGKLLATAGGGNDDGLHGEVRFRDAATGRELGRLPDTGREVTDLAFLEGGRRVVVVQAPGGSESDNTIAVWDMEEKLVIRKLVGLPAPRSVAVSPDGAWLAVGSNRGLIKVWNTATWKEVATPATEGKCVYRLAFNADGTLLSAAHWDGFASVFRLPAASVAKPPPPEKPATADGVRDSKE